MASEPVRSRVPVDHEYIMASVPSVDQYIKMKGEEAFWKWCQVKQFPLHLTYFKRRKWNWQFNKIEVYLGYIVLKNKLILRAHCIVKPKTVRNFLYLTNTRFSYGF